MKPFLVIAHRGASGHEPENTLPAFQKAVELQADWIELDVYHIEGELIVFHDAALNRTTNGRGRVMGKPLAYLRSLDAGNGHPIPFLPEVLDLVDRRVGVNIELKGPGTAGPAAALLDRYVRDKSWSSDRFIVSSFDLDALAEFKKQAPTIRTGAIFGRKPPKDCSFARDLSVASVHLRLDSFPPSLLDDAHGRGLSVYVYTVNNRQDIRRMREMGADGVFTDFPERAAGLAGAPP
jgi:glycerophosphoryl diester phosphodiesterase